MNQLSDQMARNECVRNDNNVIIEASAGAGKTHTLTMRFLNLLAGATKSPSGIVCVTFTRKSAAEMKERIKTELINAQERIAKGMNDASEMEELASKAIKKAIQEGWDTSDLSEKLNIMTFDGLCKSIVDRTPIKGSSGLEAKVHEDPAFLYKKAITSLFDKMDKGIPESNSLRRVWYHFDGKENRIFEMLSAALSKRNQWLELLQNNENTKSLLEKEILSHVQNKIEVTWKEMPGNWLSEVDNAISLIPYSNKNKHALLANICSDNEELKVRSIANWLTTKDAKAIRSRYTKNEGVEVIDKCDKDAIEELKVSLKKIKELSEPSILSKLKLITMLPSHEYTEQEWSYLKDIIGILPALEKELLEIFRKENACDFIQISSMAIDAIYKDGEITELGLELDNSIEHILVDEFQDTSEQQLTLIKSLTRGWDQSEGKTLFVVGDPKQSIYGFRASKPELFLRVQESGIENIALEKQTLMTNFRSSKAVISWVDEVFKDVFPEEGDLDLGAAPHALSDAIKTEREGEGVDVYNITSNNAISNDLAEAELVTEEIRKIGNENPQATIAVLGRNRGNIKRVIQKFDEFQIDYEAHEFKSANNTAEMHWYASIAGCVLNLWDRTSWLTLLHSGYIGVTHKDLHKAVSLSLKENIPVLYATKKCVEIKLKDRISNLIEIMEWAMEQRSARKVSDIVYSVWKAINGEAYSEHKRTTDEIEFLRGKMEELEKHSRLNMFELNQMLETSHCSIKAKGNNPVQVMTIHKSKGLEFDYVFIVGAGKKTKVDDKPIFSFEKVRNTADDYSLIFSPVSAVGDEENSIYKYLQYRNKEKQSYEINRLLYVAITRAKKRCTITVSTNEKLTPAKGSLIDGAWDTISDIKIIEAEARETENKEVNTWERTNLNTQFPTVDDGEFKSAKTIMICGKDIEIERNSIAQEFGVVAHEFMESWIKLNRSENLINKIHSFFSTRLNRKGIKLERNLLVGVNQLASNLEQLTKIYPAGVEYCEYEYLERSSSGANKKIVDYMCLTKSGDCVIFDYKFPLEFVCDEDLTEKYSKQMGDYERFGKHKSLSGNCRVELVLPLENRTISFSKNKKMENKNAA
ncbi:hypothetical protein A3715_17815 [Oleiphilus sp. HI0009]|nr:hypothetical protein A3715_17815 [Oleiphilus sp. HI0009]